MAFTENLALFFDAASGFADLATWNGSTVSAIYSAPAEDVLSGEATGTDYSLTMPATAWPGIARGATVTVTGKGTFTVREVRPLDDGAIKRVILGV